jgi:hypothetical protein
MLDRGYSFARRGSYDLEHGFPTPVVAPATFISGAVKHVSGIAFGSDGHFYAAERKAKTIKRFPASGGPDGKHFITDLPDNPEFILYVADAT